MKKNITFLELIGGTSFIILGICILFFSYGNKNLKRNYSNDISEKDMFQDIEMAFRKDIGSLTSGFSFEGGVLNFYKFLNSENEIQFNEEPVNYTLNQKVLYRKVNGDIMASFSDIFDFDIKKISNNLYEISILTENNNLKIFARSSKIDPVEDY